MNLPALAAPRRIDAGGLRWRVRVQGDGPVLLLLHGTGSSHESWDGCVARLAGRYRVVAPDLPGHAGTGAFANRRCSVERMADSVAALLAALRASPRLVAGHSAGAAVMAQLCLSGAVDPAGLLSINGALEPLSGWAGWCFPSMARLAALGGPLLPWLVSQSADASAVRRLVASTGSQLGPDQEAHYHRLLRDPTHVQGVIDMTAGWDLRRLAARLPELQPPLWLAAGSRDSTVPPAQSARWAMQLPRARLVPWPGLGHLAHEEAPHVACDLVDELAAATGRPAPTARARLAVDTR
jgi:magnesium chelatase accessory protein